MLNCHSSYSPESLHAQLQCVTRATLVLLNYVPIIEHHNLEHWSSFLAALRNVRRLEITCREPNDFSGVLDHIVWSAILVLQWPRLKTVTFTGLVCEEEELLCFVSNNSQSLARVELMSLHLVRRTGPEIDADRIAAPATEEKWPSIIHLHQTAGSPP